MLTDFLLMAKPSGRNYDLCATTRCINVILDSNYSMDEVRKAAEKLEIFAYGGVRIDKQWLWNQYKKAVLKRYEAKRCS